MNLDYNTEEVYQKILKSYQEKIPLSLMRYGDSEYIAGCPEHYYYQNVFVNQLGYFPSIPDIEKIVSNITNSIDETDIAGVTINEGETWNETKNYFLAK